MELSKATLRPSASAGLVWAGRDLVVDVHVLSAFEDGKEAVRAMRERGVAACAMAPTHAHVVRVRGRRIFAARIT